VAVLSARPPPDDPVGRLRLGVDTRTPAGRLIFTIVGAVSMIERDLLIEPTHSGLAAARARGDGRRRSYTAAHQREAQRPTSEQARILGKV
jgi:DNA invertase Pin-like site-specific DNA recombinase